MMATSFGGNEKKEFHMNKPTEALKGTIWALKGTL